MHILLLKILLAPILITLCTLAGRRYGHSAGGLIMGLPLTSGLVAFILALENGKPFAAEFSNGVLSGLPLLGIFGWCYACAAGRFQWPVSSAISCTIYVAAAWLLHLTNLPLVSTFAISVIVLGIVLFSFPKSGEESPLMRSNKWDIPLRIGIAVVVIFVLTDLSVRLGPHLSGIATTFPVYATVFAASTHHHYGSKATVRLLRGFLLGSFSYAVFFLAIGLTVVDFGIPASFGIAVAAALTLQWFLHRANGSFVRNAGTL